MTQEYKTLRELDVKPGDVVQDAGAYKEIVSSVLAGRNRVYFEGDSWSCYDGARMWRIVSRASRNETLKLWRDMTPEERGALLLAHHEGKVIESRAGNMDGWEVATAPVWHPDGFYRIRPEPKLETVTLGGAYAKGMGWIFGSTHPIDITHRITFDLIDGKPYCDSIKMEEL